MNFNQQTYGAAAAARTAVEVLEGEARSASAGERTSSGDCTSEGECANAGGADDGSAERSRAAPASAASLVFRAGARSMDDARGAGFLLRRASREVAALEPGVERALLRRLIRGFSETEGAGPLERLARALIGYAALLERRSRLAAADAVLDVARAVAPEDAELMLRSARLARLLGDPERARDLYDRVAERGEPSGHLGRLAAIGRALLATAPERAVGRAIRRAERAGALEAAAVGLEERARLRRAAGDPTGAMRDLSAATVWFTEPDDRARAAHELADAALEADRPLAARDALLDVLELGNARRGETLARLHRVSRVLGDDIGERRWQRVANGPATDEG